MIYYIADIHFGHSKVIQMDNRPFETVEEMNSFIMEAWRSTVTDHDTVYILGDLCYKSARPASWYLERLPGEKHLIIGNHDKWVSSSTRNLLESVDYLKVIKDGDRKVTLCHYPLAEWPHYYQEGYHVFGHIHNNINSASKFMENEPRALNAGVMLNGYKPCTLNELIQNREVRRDFNDMCHRGLPR